MKRVSDGKRSIRSPARPGFTLVELLIVVIIAGVVGTLAVPPIQEYRNARNAVSARDAFIMISARARAAALEHGKLVLLTVSGSKDSVFVAVRDDDGTQTRIDSLGIRADWATDLIGGDRTICYTPRGFVHPSCLDGDELPVTYTFSTSTSDVDAQLTFGRVEPE